MDSDVWNLIVWCLLIESAFEVLHEELSGHEAVFPHGDDGAVVDGVAQLRKRHVQFVHPARGAVRQLRLYARRLRCTSPQRQRRKEHTN